MSSSSEQGPGGAAPAGGRPPGRGLLRELLDRLARLVLGHRLAVAAGVLVVTGGAGLAITGLRFDFTVQELFAGDDPEIARLRQVEREFGPDDNVLLIVLRAADVFRPRALAYLSALTRAAGRVEGLARADSLATLSDLGGGGGGVVDTRPVLREPPADARAAAEIRRRALASPLIAGRLVARDGTVAVVVMPLREGLTRAREVGEVVEALEALLARTPPPPGVDARLAGVPYVRTEAVRLVQGDQLRFLPLGLVVTTLLLLLLYRSAFELVIPLVAVGLSAAYTVSLMALLGAPIDIMTNVLPLLVLVYGVADAVHLMGRIHEEMNRGAARELAVRVALRHLGVACLLTTVTTAVGFASLVAASMSILQRFGLLAAMGVGVAYVVTLVVVPLGVSFRRGQRGEGGGAPVARLPALEGALDRLGRVVTGHPRLLVAGGALVVAAALAVASRAEVNNYFLGIYREDHPTRQVTRLLERELEGVVRMQVVLEGADGAMKEPRTLAAMARTERWLAGRSEVTSTLSLATLVRHLHRSVAGRGGLPGTRQGVAGLLLMAEGERRLDRLVNYPYSRARILVGLRDVGARRYLALTEELGHVLDRHLAGTGVRGRVTGTSLVAYRGINRLVLDLLLSLSVAFGVIGLVLAVVFRSARAGLVSLLPNVAPLSVGLGFMAASGIRLEPATVMIYSIALGIAVDDTIHFFARYREELRDGREPADAARRTLRTAGRAMVFTSLILVAGFATTLTSSFPGTARFGLLGVVILSAALATDLLVTPACLLVFKPWGRRRGGPG